MNNLTGKLKLVLCGCVFMLMLPSALHAGSVILFSDNYNRSDNNNISGSAQGMEGALAPLEYVEAFEGSGEPTSICILNNQLNIAVGAGMSSLFVDHNFIDDAIVSAGGFSVSLDVVSINSAHSPADRFGGFGIGNTRQEVLDARDSFDSPDPLRPGVHLSGPGAGVSDFYIDLALDGNVRLWNNGLLLNTISVGPSAGAIRADFSVSDFISGSEVTAVVYFNDSIIDTQTFTWDHDSANYLGISGRTAGSGVLLDNLVIATFGEQSDVLFVDTQPVGRIAGVGEDVDFSVEVTSHIEGDIEFSWYRSNDPEITPTVDQIVGIGSTLQLSKVTLEDNGYYYCRVSLGNSVVYSDTARLEVFEHILFKDNFNRPNSNFISSSYEGMSGLVAPLDYVERVDAIENNHSLTHIRDGQLWMADGPNMSSNYPDYNFIDSQILDTAGMRVGLTIVQNRGPGSGAQFFCGFGIGNTQQEAVTAGRDHNETGFRGQDGGGSQTAGTSDIWVGWSPEGGGAIQVFKNGPTVMGGHNYNAATGVGLMGDDRLYLDLFFDDFKAGSPVVAVILWNGQVVGIDEFVWDHDDANYIGINARQGNGFIVDDLLVATLAEAEPIVVVDKQPANQTVDENDDVEFRFEVNLWFAENLEFAWYKSETGQIEPDSDQQVGFGSVLVIGNVSASDEGHYYCRLTVGDQVRYSDMATLSIKRKLSHWTFDEADYLDGYYLDNQGDYDALAAGSVSFVDGVIDQAVLIDQDNGWAQVDGLDPSRYSGQMAVSAWVNWAGPTDHVQQIVARRSHDVFDAESGQWQVAVEAGSNSILFQSPESVINVPDALVADGQWQHIVVTADTQTGTANVFIDGEPCGQGWNFSFAEDVEAMFIIATANVAGQLQSLHGAVDDIQVFNYAIDRLSVADIYFTVTGKKPCLNRPMFDLTGDCFVGLPDFAELALRWLKEDLYGYWRKR